MAIDVISILQGRQLSTIKRSISATERYEREVSQRATRAKELISGTCEYAGKPHYEEYRLREIYNRELENYSRKRVFTSQMNARALSLWSRAVKAWKLSGVDMETFIKAQFTYFHNVFRKAPTPMQLTTDGAVVRAASVKPEKVVTNDIPAQLDLGELFKRCERQMTEIMRAQSMTREDVYRKLVLPRLVMFPEAYLKADPTWKKVCDDKR